MSMTDGLMGWAAAVGGAGLASFALGIAVGWRLRGDAEQHHRQAWRWRQDELAVQRGLAVRCPLCQRVSYHLADVTAHYCPCCGGPGLPKLCVHDPTGEWQMARLLRTQPPRRTA